MKRLVIIALLAITAATHAQELDLWSRVKPLPAANRFTEKGFFVWCGAPVKGPDGKYHLYYSRWPVSAGFAPGWALKSEIAYAVSDKPAGPYQHVNVALPPRGINPATGQKYWDADVTHNANAFFHNGKYHLYYMGNTGDGVAMKTLNWTHRNNQRIGVAVADSPDGPWTRFDKPLIDATPGFHDALCCANPTVTERPGGGYVMVYKAVGDKKERPFGGPVVHVVAFSDSPTGPFRKQPDPVFTKEGILFAAEDPYIWCEGGKLWAIVKDNAGHFSGKGKSTVLFRSDDGGLRWVLADHPLVATLEIEWVGGRRQKLNSLERPQLFFEDGQPVVLMYAVDEDAKRTHSFNIRIPLHSRG